MMAEVKAVLSGLATYIPGHRFMKPTDGTGGAAYCYSVWLRHLCLAHAANLLRAPPHTVAELGPGDSIGIGLAALISGSENYYAFDLVRYASTQINLQIFDELVKLFEARAAIPTEDALPGVKPALACYEFPHDILSEHHLGCALSCERLGRIRASIAAMDSKDTMIRYMVPWANASVVQKGSVDMIYSQAVLEHVDDLAGAYRAMRCWLRPGGFLSHQIDFRCHRKASTWNGHWAYSDRIWGLVVGRRPYLLNRQPHSTHVRLLAENRFKLVNDMASTAPSTLRRNQLAARFKMLTDDDLRIDGAFMQAV